ncbi:GntR family transcriptional regulator [Phyllobacterium sophorae]|uniref:GntR family transcriptional regulator n=1 Tax=Phyllobacterium sophorae TaxID=1520277 RepID=A0A2P7B6K7_9HYPH|nr:GntR family transcriptional regulator [Phyllobacterium sophorae]PSH62107.1 GntR family transcriptional regulator [Phyllobacterium sophorae]
MRYESTENRSATAATYDRLKKAILSLELLPGQALAERALETFLESSRTPIRAALVKLESDGLVRKGERSYTVAPIELGELEQAFAFRALLECAAVRQAAQVATSEDIARLRALAKESSAASHEVEERAPKAEEFHLEFARIANNAFTLRALEDIMRVVYRARWLDLKTDKDDVGAREHEALIDLVEAGKGDEAAAMMERHVAHSRDRLLSAIKAQAQGLRMRGLKVSA